MLIRHLADKHPPITGSYSLVEAANSQTFDERLRELIELPVSAIATDKLVAIEADRRWRKVANLLATRRLKRCRWCATARSRHRRPLRRALRDGHLRGSVARGGAASCGREQHP